MTMFDSIGLYLTERPAVMLMAAVLVLAAVLVAASYRRRPDRSNVIRLRRRHPGWRRP